jgi:hypothetical protein
LVVLDDQNLRSLVRGIPPFSRRFLVIGGTYSGKRR